ncbi:MAG: nitric oxide reductase NorE protein [Psychromonas sp.]|jgi:nitric oxide reductase NorE protein
MAMNKAVNCDSGTRGENTATSKTYLPGDLAMWFFILAELTVFAIFFIGFAITRQIYPQMFIDGQAYLHPVAGAINTIALITSSLFVALSVQDIKQGAEGSAKRYLLGALVMGAIYIGVKSWEYAQLMNSGIGLSTNSYFTLYFMITAFHYMHVLLGMVILAAIALKTQRGGYQGKSLSGFEAGACYWHMVDLVWVILFPLIYVIK